MDLLIQSESTFSGRTNPPPLSRPPLAQGRDSGEHSNQLSAGSIVAHEFAIQRKRRRLHVGEAIALQWPDRRRVTQQFGGALDKTFAIERRNAAGRIQIGQQLAHAAVVITEHWPA